MKRLQQVWQIIARMYLQSDIRSTAPPQLQRNQGFQLPTIIGIFYRKFFTHRWGKFTTIRSLLLRTRRVIVTRTQA